MRTVSDRFLNALRGSHKMVARATLLTESYQEGTSPTGTDIPILGGNVILSATNDIRATLELTADGTAWDSTPGASLTPYGNEIYVERGIEYGDGSREWVSLGYFRIYSVDQDDVPNGPIRITGRDRMSKVIDAKVEKPRDFSSWEMDSVFYSLINSTINADVLYPDPPVTPTEFADGTVETAIIKVGTMVDQDRYAFLKDLARSYGQIMYFDYRGILQVEPVPTSVTPVWEVNAGQSGVLVELKRNLTREGLYNAVVATGEAADDAVPARAVVRDVNPDSPTNYYGNFGPVPTFYSSPQLTTTAACINAGTGLLRQQLGRPASIDFTSIPNPALEPFDPVSVDYGPATEVHILDDITIPLTADQPLTSTTRTSVGESFEVA